jgi:competence protein ComFA
MKGEFFMIDAGRLNPFLFDEEIGEACSKFPAVELQGKEIFCRRCGQKTKAANVTLPNGHFYCPHCINMGRVCTGTIFAHTALTQRPGKINPCTWDGQLTSGQSTVAQELTKAVEDKGSILVHAVTGAGKTEMLFPALTRALEKGFHCAIASPRVDVCNELFPRIKESFEQCEVTLLHGTSETIYTESDIVICSTHQLLRFYEAFDLLIIDEVDSFPFVDSEELHFAVEHAKKPVSTFIYLTATPTNALLKDVAHGTIKRLTLPARFHRKPLVVPKFVWCSKWQEKISAGKMPLALRRSIQTCMDDNFPFLIFVPAIYLLEPLASAFSKVFPDLRVAHVSAEDKKRHEKVQAMRNGVLDCLLTSTILERGVTFPGVSVIVLGSNHRVFKRSALVQIAGRVGRKAIRTDGRVLFLHDGKTREMVQAKKEIEAMNRLAQKEGLLD